jgi:NhaA family Na+:H+ antiporter
LLQPVPLGIAAGLFIGKQVGIFVSALIAVKLGLAARPERASWTQLFGVSLICGIGFTMSLFIGLLAFPDDAALQLKRARKLLCLQMPLLAQRASQAALGISSAVRSRSVRSASLVRWR